MTIVSSRTPLRPSRSGSWKLKLMTLFGVGPERLLRVLLKAVDEFREGARVSRNSWNCSRWSWPVFGFHGSERGRWAGSLLQQIAWRRGDGGPVAVLVARPSPPARRGADSWGDPVDLERESPQFSEFYSRSTSLS